MAVSKSTTRRMAPVGIWLGGLAALGILGATWGCAPEAQEAPTPEEAPRPVPVRSMVLEPEDAVQRVSYPADLLPVRRATLAAEVAGTVEALEVREGERVEAGRVLAQVDTRALRQAVAEAEALAFQAASQLERIQRLVEKKAVIERALLDATTERDVAEARLATARLRLESSRLDAPWAGTVARLLVEQGDYVAPGQPMVELLDTSRLKVRAPVPSADVPSLLLGTEVELRVDALPGEVFTGRITRLAAELDSDARTLDVEVLLGNADGRLRPGLPGRMEIALRRLPGVLLVPLEAVEDLGTEKAVYVIEGGWARRRPVELGPILGRRAVVLDGLEPGERVVSSGVQQVGDGQAVTEVGEG